MIDNLNDVNRVLLALETLEAARARTPRGLLLRYLNGEVIYGQNPQFEPIIDFMKLTELVSENSKGVGITFLGRELLLQNSIKAYELQPTQRPLMLRKCYLDGPFRAHSKGLIKKFVVNQNTRRLSWSSVDSEPLGEVEWVSTHLLQLGVLQRSQHLLVATPEYNPVLISFSEEVADFTEAQFAQVLKQKHLLGRIAEAFVLQWEKRRLNRAGQRREAACVNRISKRQVQAGYDIASFDGVSDLLAHDRFIEVKGSGKTTVQFVWTPNEMKVATLLRQKYWIYFVGGIERRKRLVTREPVMIRDPHTTLTAGEGFTVQPKGEVLVSANIAGNRLHHTAQIKQ